MPCCFFFRGEGSGDLKAILKIQELRRSTGKKKGVQKGIEDLVVDPPTCTETA